MKKITAKFKSHCAETGARINKGDVMYYNYQNKKCYSLGSERGKFEESNIGTVWEADNVGAYIQAEQEAYFDNFCQRNNI